MMSTVVSTRLTDEEIAKLALNPEETSKFYIVAENVKNERDRVEVGTEVKLAGKTLYPPADCPAGAKDGCAKVKALRESNEGVKILRHFDGPGGARSILLLQVTPAGNACNGGPLFFVRLASNAPPQFSDVFDHCGGPDPMVGAMADKIVVSVPAHPPNRGTGTIAAKSMEYDIATGVLAAPSDKGGKKKGAH